ncbi:MAG: hypothetical protein KJ061_14265 [Vicinamibacteraceae bacterium]|nr:hypothetical protein [Vicinamibacteraceae bacterium]
MWPGAAPPTRRPSPRACHGFGIVDTLVAVSLSSLVLSSILPLLLAARDRQIDAGRQAEAAALAASKLDLLASLAWQVTVLPSGIRAPREDLATTLAHDVPAGGGQGLAPSPPGTLVANVPGYVDYLDSEGRWIGEGRDIPRHAAFVRRWAVLADPAHPDVRFLQVLVARAEVERRAPPRAGLSPRAGDVWMSTARFRWVR